MRLWSSLLAFFCLLALCGCKLQPAREIPAPHGPDSLDSFCIALSDNIRYVAFVPDGRSVAATHYDSSARSNYLAFHNRQNWENSRVIRQKDIDNPSFAFSPDGKLIASPGRNSVEIIDSQTGTLIRKLAYHARENSHRSISLCFSPDGKLLAAVEPALSSLLVWDFATGNQLWFQKAAPQEIYGVAFSPNSQVLVGAGWGERKEKRLRMWKANNGRLIRTFKGAAYSVDAPLVYSPDGKFIATSGFPPSHKEEKPEISATEDWNMTQQDFVVMLWNPRSGKLERTFREVHYPQRSLSYLPVGFSRNSQQIVLASDSKVDVYNVATGQRIQRLDVGGGELRVLSPDAKSLFSETPPPDCSGHGGTFWKLK